MGYSRSAGQGYRFSKGMGGSMHLIIILTMMVPIVSGTVPLAVGAAFQARGPEKRNSSHW